MARAARMPRIMRSTSDCSLNRLNWMRGGSSGFAERSVTWPAAVLPDHRQRADQRVRRFADKRVPHVACADLDGRADELHVGTVESRCGAQKQIARGTVGGERSAAEQRPAQHRHGRAIRAHRTLERPRERAPGDGQERVLDEILSHARQIDERFDPVFREFICRPDARQHE